MLKLIEPGKWVPVSQSMFRIAKLKCLVSGWFGEHHALKNANLLVNLVKLDWQKKFS
jgi:hypothetical protein